MELFRRTFQTGFEGDPKAPADAGIARVPPICSLAAARILLYAKLVSGRTDFVLAGTMLCHGLSRLRLPAHPRPRAQNGIVEPAEPGSIHRNHPESNRINQNTQRGKCYENAVIHVAPGICDVLSTFIRMSRQQGSAHYGRKQRSSVSPAFHPQDD
jgi:hypothetical protein